ncbi:MAG: DnaJ domain-containing protein [Spirochaetia bacterium]
MTVHTAYDILSLPHNATARDLVLAYRRLVKRYHPDYNVDRQAWSTEKMTNINLAYETVRAVLSSPVAEARAGRRSADNEPGTTFEEREAARRSHFSRRADSPGAQTPDGSPGSPPYGAGESTAHRSARSRTARPYVPRPGAPTISPQFSRIFDKPWQFVVDGLYVYYQYGLENVHMRREGVHRFRYRQAVKSVKDGIAGLDPLDEDTVTAADAQRLAAARGFSRAFLQNMLIEKYYIPSRAGPELKAYNHYNNGSRHLDQAIKRRFCHELRLPHEPPVGSGMLQVVQHELITVIAKYTDSTWVPESMIKMHLLDRFNAVVEARLSA